ncbi:HNH endonuclease [Amycolatopsis sp. NBC_01480]|uniref:HNH endonuclease n=1 Tax=Amycolatopsis sp. NBC_01480 TaxID=2903562 RepID=UPI002E2E6A95|nr:HNH endonuclease [Amycolatopsis sp. NBC_01480]
MPNSCKEWTGSRMGTGGYGYLSVGGKRVLAHRWIWEQANGPIPAGKQVCHTCLDHPGCVELTHLVALTPKEKIAANAARGRHPHNYNFPPLTREQRARGSRMGTSKLTEDQVIEIRRLRAAGQTITSLAADFGVSNPLISMIARRVIWTHVA